MKLHTYTATLTVLVLSLIVGIGAAEARGRVVYEAAYQAAIKGNDARAVELFTQAITTTKMTRRNLASAYYNRGLSYAKLGMFKKALADYDAAIELKPDYVQALNNRGYLRLRMGDHPAALRDLAQAVTLLPNNAMALTLSGIAYSHLGMYDMAAAELCRAIKVNQTYADAYAHYAWLLATCPLEKYRNGELALKLAKKAVFIKPSAMNLDVLAAAYAETGNFEKAVATQQKAMLKLKKTQLTAHYQDFADRYEVYQSQRPWRQVNRQQF